MDDLLFPGMIDPLHDEAKKKILLTALHEVLRRGRGKVVVNYQPPELGRNYCRVGVKFDHGPALWILLNPAAGLVAAAEMGSGREADEIVQGRRGSGSPAPRR
ncbi:hypothetical protein [Kineosporia sp. NBRC 101731]|uniref:hypothetical protein n=1 Tax=Kineosporia sp. NBRC 101731 TaxID=3032199 RepID=UPI002555A916|nr:hypothetical protein [Kineosporia sp. NBRC 101731]